MMATTDPRVAAYLRQLEETASGLRPERRAELLAEIREHIETRLGQAAVDAPGTDAVEVTLARLGEPEEIVAAADEPADLPGPTDRDVRRDGLGGREIAALLLVPLGGFLLLVGWVVGIALLWASPVWTTREKLVATFVWPLGLLPPVLITGMVATTSSTTCTSVETSVSAPIETCTGAGGGTNLVALVLTLAVLAAPVVVAFVLGSRASRRTAAA